MFLKYASGQATEESYYTLMLLGGQDEYKLTDGIIDIMEFNSDGYGETGINTLFTIQNQMFNAGMIDFGNLSTGLTLLSYHMALDFIEVLTRYTTTGFQWTYDDYDNILKIMPVPKSGETMSIIDPETNKQINYDSPGYIMFKAKQLVGAGRPGFSYEKAYNKLFVHEWIRFYVLALCKITLGLIRIKFESFGSVGNTGISLNGSELISQGKEEKDKLEEELRSIQCFEGFGISTGII